MKKKFYIKERFNPQFDKPYYVLLGQRTKKDISKMGESIHGQNNILTYDTEVEYDEAIKKLKADGLHIHNG